RIAARRKIHLRNRVQCADRTAMIDLASITKVESAFEDMRAPHIRQIVDVLNGSEIAVIAEERIQRIGDRIVQRKGLVHRGRKTRIHKGISEAIETDDQLIRESRGRTEPVIN